MVIFQRTLAKEVVFIGKGLHTGRIVRMEVHPTSANYGIRFIRTDSERAEIVTASYLNISATDLCTTIGSGANSISTIEHLMAAFAGLGIDNALVRLNGPEVPIMDGSSKIFVSEFLKTGMFDLPEQKKFLIAKEKFEFSQGDRYFRIEPARHLKFSCEIDFNSKVIGKQKIDLSFDLKNFLKLSDARTFCHQNEVNALKRVGLAQGGSLENAVVVTDECVLNQEGLRGGDEFVRHKLLDGIGDFALLGYSLIGHITFVKAGHGFNAACMQQLMLNRHRIFTTIESNVATRDVISYPPFAVGAMY